MSSSRTEGCGSTVSGQRDACTAGKSVTWLGVRDSPSEMEAVMRSESKLSAQKEAVTPNICITMTKQRKPVKRIETRRIRAERVGAITLPGCSQRGAV